MIYFIACGTEAVKIGYTRDPNAVGRLSSLQSGNHRELTCIAQVPTGGPKAEKLLHKALADARIRGEWFRLDEDVRAVVRFVIDNPEADVPTVLAGALAVEPESTDEQERLIESLESAGEWRTRRPIGDRYLVMHRLVEKRKRGGTIQVRRTSTGDQILADLKRMLARNNDPNA